MNDTRTCPHCKSAVPVELEWDAIDEPVICPKCEAVAYLCYDEEVAEDYSDVWQVWTLEKAPF